MVGPPLDVVDYPLSSKLNLSDCSQAVRMISHRSHSHRWFYFRSRLHDRGGFFFFFLRIFVIENPFRGKRMSIRVQKR